MEAPDDREGIPPRPMRPLVDPATLGIPPMPLRPPPRPPPQEDLATLYPVHLAVREEPGPFFPSDPTMPYTDHWQMVDPDAESE